MRGECRPAGRRTVVGQVLAGRLWVEAVDWGTGTKPPKPRLELRPEPPKPRLELRPEPPKPMRDMREFEFTFAASRRLRDGDCLA